MDKNKVYENIYNMLTNGVFLNKYMELSDCTLLDESSPETYEETKNHLEDIAANIFNAILIGCQLFDDEERILEFIDIFSSYLSPEYLARTLPSFNITKEEALERLKHGFGVHFTTPNICNLIKDKGYLAHFGENAMFTKEEDQIITAATKEQIAADRKDKDTLNYLYRGFGTGVSSYGSITNGFWMYHTPESLSCLFGDISKRNKEIAMNHVISAISNLKPDNQRKTLNVMRNIYDRLIGTDESVGCVLIDRDSFKYDVDYYYDTGTPVPIERRPYRTSLNSLTDNDSQITNDIPATSLRFLSIPTVISLERQKAEMLESSKNHIR